LKFTSTARIRVHDGYAWSAFDQSTTPMVWTGDVVVTLMTSSTLTRLYHLK